MKYYLYISQTKLEMIAQQIPEPLKQKYSGEFGINWWIVTAKASTEVETSSVSRTVDGVSEFIVQQKNPGSLQDAREWALDRMTVKHLTVKEDPNLFLLVGLKDGIYHCLGGSAHHVIGNRRGADADINYSYFPYMVGAIQREFSEEGIAGRESREEFFGKEKVRSDFAGVKTHEWADAVRALYEWSDAPTFEVAFLARQLAYGRSLHGDYCAVWSPLYIELKST
ncbi:hypothetical protein E0H39_07135 [Rhizobium leguminosarum bv. viciae]|uniref:DUF7019 family protein n=1 Tax=Rhizobium leguminosarum TaxID=384 RepID=UPI0010389067|nr:SAVMC3_10250 family protein [Rhizobium leguminosarum]TBY65765.1 hypothetical protein E0H39_07135 [Rhizobium leguminosarum bv. viciae]